MAGMPTDSELESAVREALRVVNIDEVSLKIIRRRLEALFEVDLSVKKAFLKDTVTAIMSEDPVKEDAEEEEGEEEEEDAEPAKKTAKAKTKRAAEYQLSPALYEFMGSKEEFMAHTDVTKAVWAHIRAASLQDPKDGRKIRNDEKMFPVFKCKTMNMMHISRKLSPHLKKYSDLVPSEAVSDEDRSERGERASGGADSKKRGAAGASATPKAKKAKTGATPKSRPKAGSGSSGKRGAVKGKKAEEAPVKKTRKPSTIMWRVSDELAAVVGSTDATVDTIRSGVHKYIKEHNLQDPEKRTMVICDPTLERVMGQKVVKMFGMQSLITPHRLHKL
ncbi:unnamed protein product [Pylaiella littoralis]